MSDLEVRFQEHFGPLVERTWPNLAQEIIHEAGKYRDIILRWALKTAAMVDQNSGLKSIIDKSLLHEIRFGIVPKNVFLEIGHSDLLHVGAVATRGFMTKNGSLPFAWNEHRDHTAFSCLIQLNHLLLRVFRCPSAKPTYLAPRFRFPLGFFPELHDPYSVNFSFKDMFEFSRSLLLETSSNFN